MSTTAVSNFRSACRRSGLVLLLALASLGCGEPPKPAPKRPNVLLISLDTLRADRLASYGHERRTSPNIDSLARRGVLFENAYSQSPKTAISHMSIMTGLQPEAHGVRQMGAPDSERLSDDIPTLAALLLSAGYKTAAITAGGHMSPKLGFDLGMQSYEEVVRPTDLLARAIHTVDRLSPGDTPFFLFLHTYGIHDPYVPKEPYRSLYTDPEYSGKIVSDPLELQNRAGSGWIRQHDLYWKLVDAGDPRDVQHLLDLYDASIRFIDHLIGSLITQLEIRGLLDQTLVILLSDHGEQFAEHGAFQHSHLYQEILHVPLLFVPPKSDTSITRGTRETARVQLIDVMPTVLEFLDIPVPEHVQGRSFLSILRGEAVPDQAIASSWPRFGMASLRKHDWKLMRERSTVGTTRELYDLASDPGEQENLVAAHPDVAASLDAELDTMVKRSEALRSKFGKGRPISMDADTQRRLEQLGYIK